MDTFNEEEKRSVFEIASKEYTDLTEFLKTKVFPHREEYEKSRGNNDYVAEYGLNSFDLMLQFSFLELACADGKITSDEIEMIQKICKYDSLAHFIERNGVTGFSWSSFLEMSIDEAKHVLNSIGGVVFDIAQDFITSFALFDSFVKSKDFLKVFERSVYAFLMCLFSSDGELVEAEQKSQCMLYAAINKIKETKEALDSSEMEKPNEEAIKAAAEEVNALKEHRSLKDCYEKKKIAIAVTEHQVDYTDKEKALVYIETEGKNSGSGSGFVITENGLCFTCYHVVKDATEIYIRLDDGEGHRIVKPAVINYFDEDDDFAILQILDIKWSYYFKLEDNYVSVKMGDDIAILGFPFGRSLNEDVLELEPTLTRGYVASKNKIDGKAVYYLDARSCPGNSGGPVFSLKTNKVIGYLCGSYGADRANLVYCRSFTEFFDTVVSK